VDKQKAVKNLGEGGGEDSNRGCGAGRALHMPPRCSIGGVYRIAGVADSCYLLLPPAACARCSLLLGISSRRL